MTTTAQIITAIVSGIVSLGLLIFIFRHILSRLDKKVDKEVFKEYVVRISENLSAGKKRFDRLDNGLAESTNAVNRLCIAIKGIEILLEERLDKKKDKRG